MEDLEQLSGKVKALDIKTNKKRWKMDKNEKLILKVQKIYSPANAYLRITTDVAEKVKSVAKNVNKDYSTIACELLEFALDRVEIID